MHKRDTLVIRKKIKTVQTMNIKTQVSRMRLRLKNAGRVVSPLFVAALFLVSFITPGAVARISAATCTTITECQEQISANNNAVAELKKNALSYQDAIQRLNSEINTLQGAIDANTAEQNRLQKEIEKAQAEIDRQRSILAQGVKAMYVDGTPSTLEMIASSKNLSDYVDKQEYRTAVQRKLQDTLKTIAILQKQLSEQRVQVAALLKTQQSQQASLVSARVEQSSMLSYNKSQQAAYNQETAANKNKLDQLIAAQRAANNVTSGSGYYLLRFPGTVRSINPSAYPYANAGFSMSTAPGCVDNDGPDEWGYCTRQCVSFAAWAVEASGRSAPRYYGSAKYWVAKARANGVGVYTSNPQPGDVLISTSGTWGHAMYVYAASGNTAYIYEYNQQLNGRLRTDRAINL